MSNTINSYYDRLGPAVFWSRDEVLTILIENFHQSAGLLPLVVGEVVAVFLVVAFVSTFWPGCDSFHLLESLHLLIDLLLALTFYRRWSLVIIILEKRCYRCPQVYHGKCSFYGIWNLSVTVLEDRTSYITIMEVYSKY